MDAAEYWYDGNMEDVKKAYLQCSIPPRLQMKSFLEIKSIKVPVADREFAIIHSAPREHEHILEFTKRIGIPYRGESLSVITLKA